MLRHGVAKKTLVPGAQRQCQQYCMKTYVFRSVGELVGCVALSLLAPASSALAATGAVHATWTYALAEVSGAHFNPTTTLTFVVLGHTHPVEGLWYMVSQVAGCSLGLVLHRWLSGAAAGCIISDAPFVILFSREVLLGVFCNIAAFVVMWYTQSKDGYGTIGPVIIGAANAATSLWPECVASPARVVATSLIYRDGNIVRYG